MKIWAKTKEFSEGKFLVVRRDGSVPHWPYFVLGARDPAATAGLLAYANEAEKLGYDPAYVASVRELATLDFPAYLAHEGAGDPEAAPHRKDDPNVIAAMRGPHQATITVTRDRHNVATAYTPAEFGEFCRLNELTSTVELHKFMNKHGRAKCNAMRAALCPR